MDQNQFFGVDDKIIDQVEKIETGASQSLPEPFWSQCPCEYGICDECPRLNGGTYG